jgi:L-asparaginase II
MLINANGSVRAHVICLDEAGLLVRHMGHHPSHDIRGRCSSRSKPPAMVVAGLGLDTRLLALAAGSHRGAPFYVDGVRAILTAAGWMRLACRTRARFHSRRMSGTATFAQAASSPRRSPAAATTSMRIAKEIIDLSACLSIRSSAERTIESCDRRT